ncbi:cytochrome P450 monooxygenase 4 [Heterobasidion irregulare TC 32-1]|uniref:Cytochrome P450 monooxygenase 4 n=1 Tax=Heterobasidion irregulare (strain TC 32-1) TaxID=747525 RepID=W4JUM4_HETIT|nr:cytochrome P450 monooxygenase 4 [Heterobasidion irregulare TC 32-1]ETW77258.1 cytochrome P450 monooxygenase 4 [Heterobasidion irregulare TC 32-1]
MFVGILDCIVLLGGAILLNGYLKRRRTSGLPYPPGPLPLPLIGNVFDIPKRKAWETYAQWAKQYGDLMSIQALGQTAVIVNSAKIARDLLEKRGSIYSDRPVVPALELMKFDFNVFMARYRTSRWKIGRKIAEHSLRQSAAVAYRPMQLRKIHDFLRKLVCYARRFIDPLDSMTAAIIMSLTYGYEIAESHDKFVGQVEGIVQRASAAILPGATLINFLPFLKYLPAWLPGMSFKRDALDHIEETIFTVDAPYSFTQGEIRQGTARPSVILESMKTFSDRTMTNDEEDALKGVAATMYIAGSDTVGCTYDVFLLALVEYPDVQKRAQEEIDLVVGRDRLPDYDDRPRLPYINAVCQELMRWRMVTPLGVVHTTTEDDVYEGYFIPKGSQIWVNAWAMLHDPIAYPDPESFRPERFLTSDGTVIEDPLLNSAFGWGRRICPGRFLADANIWAIVASVLSTFVVGKAKDAQGKEIPVNGEFTDEGIVCQPLPFPCSLVLRDARAGQLVADTKLETE